MKKTISLLLIGCLVLTIVVSAAPACSTTSMPLNNQQMQTSVGGNLQSFFCGMAFVSFDAWAGTALVLAEVSGFWGIGASIIIGAAGALIC